MYDLLSYIFPLLGVILGAGLQYYFSLSTELKRHERTLKIDAYSEYLRSIGEAETLLVNLDPSYRSEILARAIASKSRVCVHGTAKVVTALSKFEGAPAQGLTPEKKKYLLEFLEAVREDIGAQGELSQTAIEKILFGS